jgi:hypothetical protein
MGVWIRIRADLPSHPAPYVDPIRPKVGFFLARGQQLGASSFCCQRPFTALLFRSGANSSLYHLFAFMSSKNHALFGNYRTQNGVEQAFMPAIETENCFLPCAAGPARSQRRSALKRKQVLCLDHVAVVHFANLPQCGQRFQYLLYAGPTGADEPAGDLVHAEHLV